MQPFIKTHNCAKLWWGNQVVYKDNVTTWQATGTINFIYLTVNLYLLMDKFANFSLVSKDFYFGGAELRVKKEKNKQVFTYSGSLDVEVKKCEKEIIKINELLPFLEFSFKEAKKAYERKSKRLEQLSAFVELAKAELSKESN